ncbi:MAG: hypothetical protein ACMXYD_02725 [Candidatus Woesearchaeota archaeon]
MSALSAAEREELRTLRENLVNRMNELQDQEDQGLITAQERYEKLQEEYGEDYQESLSELNTLLHANKQEHKILPRTLIAGMLAVLLVAFAISAYFTISPTGLAVFESTQEIRLDKTLHPGQNTILELPETTTIRNIQLTKQTTLTLEDATREFTLYKNRCVGCGQKITAPYLLTNTGEEATTIQTITIKT